MTKNSYIRRLREALKNMAFWVGTNRCCWEEESCIGSQLFHLECIEYNELLFSVDYESLL